MTTTRRGDAPLWQGEDHYGNFYHPSFLPLLDRIPERGMYSPYLHVTSGPYYDEHGNSHDHLFMAGDGTPGGNILLCGGSIEEVGEGLADAVRICHRDRHKGKGFEHTNDDVIEAYRTAIEQTQARRPDQEHAFMVWKQYVYKKWGGHMPALLMLPTEDEWKLMIPDEHGDPVFHDMDQSAVEGVPELVVGENAEEAEIGYLTLQKDDD